MNKVYIGRIVKAHGLKGMVLIETYAENSRHVKPEIRILVENGDDVLQLTVNEVRTQSGKISVAFKEINDRESAEALVNSQVLIFSEQLDDLPDNEFYVFELVGCTVKTSDGKEQGIVKDILDSPGNDLLQVEKNNKMYLVPVVKAVIRKIDIENSEIVLNDIDGLFD